MYIMSALQNDETPSRLLTSVMENERGSAEVMEARQKVKRMLDAQMAQRDCVEAAERQNLLCVLPTNSGKTHAAMEALVSPAAMLHPARACSWCQSCKRRN